MVINKENFFLGGGSFYIGYKANSTPAIPPTPPITFPTFEWKKGRGATDSTPLPLRLLVVKFVSYSLPDRSYQWFPVNHLNYITSQ